MLKDLRIFRRNSGKIPPGERNENIPIEPQDSAAASALPPDADPTRPPLQTIQEPLQNPRTRPDQEPSLQRKLERTPSKNKGSEPFRTPEKPRGKFGWVPRNDPPTNSSETGGGSDELSHQGSFHMPPPFGRGGYSLTTPRTYRTTTASTTGKASSVHSDASSTHSTPTKSVSKPAGFSGSSRPPLSTGTRGANFSAAAKGMAMSSAPLTTVNSAEVPHFELKEEPSFWLDHNVQVVIRVRPLNSTERSLQGYVRCLKQESAQSITWLGQPETRFTFDYVACETINQETLFRVAGLPMVENCMSGYNSCMFAYGQTGSGKTYTMLGEIGELEFRPSLDRGMTPRIFEFLFARIRAEEESRRDEKLKYNCKCSFLEIYNEQITDLLDSSSANLLLREDLRKGVYVENLTEFKVETVNDILKLLIQGAANRKVAATNMNRESSRSHSVFTCVIESKWEQDSTTNLRFARLNLVDLAGSERQKTSGAEGERLKEAANINRSLSTLGHVIMVLADVAHGKQKHVPYRDSRLTFLLQDSLGGNSKTIIMANVSPSICSANETLSTLKFAQRARLVQNNAVVNEDSSGDIVALQHQIHLLKEELSVLKHQNISRSLSFRTAIIEEEHEMCNISSLESLHGTVQTNDNEFHQNNVSASIRVSTKQLKSLEATLAGAMRREKMADITIKQLEAEMEQLNRLVRQREEDTRCSKMMLKFREDKIHRMEALLHDLMPTETYLMEENTALSEETQLLRTRVDRNPEVTRFALENIRLVDQLRRFQDFYEEGERELLLAEVSDLRNQLIQFLDRESEQDHHSKEATMIPQEDGHIQSANSNRDNDSMKIQLKKVCQELEDCRNNLRSCLETNATLTREMNSLHIELNNMQTSSCDKLGHNEPQNVESCLASPHSDHQIEAMRLELASEYATKHGEEILNFQLELDILKTILGEEKSLRIEVEEKVIHTHHELNAANETLLCTREKNDDLKNELKDARSIIEALECQNTMALNELEELRENNTNYAELLKKQEHEVCVLKKQLGIHYEGEGKSFLHEELKGLPAKYDEFEDSPLQAKLRRMQASVEKAFSLNLKYQGDQASQMSIEREMDEVRRQVEVETSEVIVCLQEELITLQQQVEDSNRKELLAKQSMITIESEVKELRERLFFMTQENERLAELSEAKESDIRSLTEDWERLACEIADVLSDGNVALKDASDQVASISDSFPQRIWISEQVQHMVTCISERDTLIEELQKCLEDAQKVRCDMEWKLRSLRGATLAITEAQQHETSEKEREILLLTSQLHEKHGIIAELENEIKLGEEMLKKAEIHATVAFITVNRLSDTNKSHLQALENANLMLCESTEKNFQNDTLLHYYISSHADAVRQIEVLKLDLQQSQKHAAQLKQSHEQEKEKALENLLQKEEAELALSGLANDIFKATSVANQIKMSVCTLHTLMGEYMEQSSTCAHTFETCSAETADCNLEDPMEVKSTRDVINSEHHNVHDVEDSTDNPATSNVDDSVCCKSAGVPSDRESIFLMTKEIASAFESLQEVQGEMIKLISEKEEMQKSEIRRRKNMEHLSAELLQLKSNIIDSEKQFQSRLLELEHKLKTVEENAIASNTCWREAKEGFEFEISAAKAVATQKTVEASNLLENIEAAQETMKDADIMVNALIYANENAKLEIERLQKTEVMLNNEKECLVGEREDLRASLYSKEQEYMSMQKNFHLHLQETSSLVLTVGDAFRHLKSTFTEKFELLTCDIDWIKHQLHRYSELARTWLEEIWSEIIGKDCAVSVLHLCHMGILLERITGLNAENGFLYRGLCESNSVIVDLKEHNSRAERELEICSLLKGKLLSDINDSFNRITKKEDEAIEFKDKLMSFENKIQFLQSQEESMMARSNSMGTELAILMKELDATSRNASTVVSVKEKLLRKNEDLQNKLNETLHMLEMEKRVQEMLKYSFCEELDWLVFQFHTDSYVKINEMKSCHAGIKKAPELDHKFIEYQIESIMTNLFAKELELLVLESELSCKIAGFNNQASLIIDLERQRGTLDEVIEKMKNEMILNQLDGELKSSELCTLFVENEKLKSELLKLREDHSITTENLQEAKMEFISALSHTNLVNQQNLKLKEIACTLEARITSLQTDIASKNAELEEIRCSHTAISKELDLKSAVTEIQAEKINSVEAENAFIKNEIISCTSSMFSFKLNHCNNRIQSVNVALDRMSHLTNDQVVLLMNKQCQEISEHRKMASKVVNRLESLALTVMEMMSENFTLQSELKHKDEVLKGLLFDLSILQESASIEKDLKDEAEVMADRLESLENELESKSCELDKVAADARVLKSQLLEKNKKIAILESEINEKDAKVELVSDENFEFKAQTKRLVEVKNTIEQELRAKTEVAESLEEELLELSNLISEKDRSLEDLHDNMAVLAGQRDHLDSVVQVLKEKLEMAYALAEENEAIATEARQIAEGRKAYAEDKEEEVRLLERSVEELESTVSALENKVYIVKGEAERQRLQREELENELQAVRSQMSIIPSTGNNWNSTMDEEVELSRHLNGVTQLQEANQTIHVLQKEVEVKDTEILQCKSHISELNMHAEAQAREYKLKFKELEAMAQQVKADTAPSGATTLTSTKAEKCAVKSRGSCSPSSATTSSKLEKGAAKSRGSGSPFKCIGLGLAQQMNSEKDEELTVARRRIEDLETLAAGRQKEIFMLNTRLAAAESMTHDVIRDLLGVKLDMANYATLLDHQPVLNEKAISRSNSQEENEKEKEVSLLQQQLNEFIQERQSWLDEINLRQTEMVTARIMSEKLRQREQFLTTENEFLKSDLAKHKTIVMELEDEVNRLSNQHNLQQRIHHHAKIKEENNLLRIQKEELSLKLQRSETVLSRVREELARYRASTGKKPYIDIDEEDQLRKKLDEKEEERIRLAEKLLGLCTCILKVAGLPGNGSVSAAEGALSQIDDRINALESELQDLKLQCRISCEKLRLSELKQHRFSLTDENCPSTSSSNDSLAVS